MLTNTTNCTHACTVLTASHLFTHNTSVILRSPSIILRKNDRQKELLLVNCAVCRQFVFKISNCVLKTEQLCSHEQAPTGQTDRQTDRQSVHITTICKNKTPATSLFISRRTANSFDNAVLYTTVRRHTIILPDSLYI